MFALFNSSKPSSDRNASLSFFSAPPAAPLPSRSPKKTHVVFSITNGRVQVMGQRHSSANGTSCATHNHAHTATAPAAAPATLRAKPTIMPTPTRTNHAAAPSSSEPASIRNPAKPMAIRRREAHPAMRTWHRLHVDTRPTQARTRAHAASVHVLMDERVVETFFVRNDSTPLSLQWATPMTMAMAQMNLVDPLRRQPIRLEPSTVSHSPTSTPPDTPSRSLFGRAPQLTVRPRSAPVTVLEFMRASNRVQNTDAPTA